MSRKIHDEVSLSISSRQLLYECERSYKRRVLKEINGRIEYVNVDQKETLYILAQEHEIVNLPTTCKVIKKCTNMEKNRLLRKSIPIAEYIEKRDSVFPLSPDYIPNPKKHYYCGECTYKQIYCVQKDGETKYYQSQIVHEGYYALTDDEVCNLGCMQFRKVNEKDADFQEYDDILGIVSKLEKIQACGYSVLPHILYEPVDGDVELTELPPGIEQEFVHQSLQRRSSHKSTDDEGEYQPQRRQYANPSPYATVNRRSTYRGSAAQSITHEDEYEEERELRSRLRTAGVSSRSVSPTKPSYTMGTTYQMTFKELNDKMSETYNFEELMRSTTIDIVGVYLKGQKLLYVESKVYCEQYLYALMIPAIFITALCSILSLILRDSQSGPIVISSLTAINSVILSLVTYLKLDAKAEAHKTTAYSFEKLQSLCEFSSGRLLFKDKRISPYELIEKIGEDVKDIKDKNQFILPQYIRHRFPILYSTNVFAEVKRIQNNEIILINDLKTLINDNYMILADLQKQGKTTSPELVLNLKKQKKAFDAIIAFRNRYIDIDDGFKSEIEDDILANKKKCQWFNWLKT